MLPYGIVLYLQHPAFVKDYAGAGVGIQPKDHAISAYAYDTNYDCHTLIKYEIQ